MFLGGKKEKAKLFDKENILAISEYLKKTNCRILNQDYQQLLPLIKEKDFLLVDPPYDSEKTVLVNGLLSVKQNENCFNSYTANKFTRQNQQELFNFLKKCEKQGAKWLLTNHATNFIKELYQDYWQFTHKAQRFINCQGDKRIGAAQEIFIGNYPLTEQQKKELEFYHWFDSIQSTNIDLGQLVNWEKIHANIANILNSLICVSQEELNRQIIKIWQENPRSFQILPYLLAIRDNENFAWLEQEIYSAEQNIEYWEDLTLEKVKKLIFNSGLAEYLTNGKIKDLKDYCLGIEVGLGTHGRKNVGGKVMEKAVERLLNKYGVEYQKQIPVDFQVNGKKLFDFQIKVKNQNYYLETSFFNVAGSKVQEVIRSYSEAVLKKAQNNEINFLWILDGKGLKSCKELVKNTYLKNKDFMFTLVGFEKWLGKREKLNQKWRKKLER